MYCIYCGTNINDKANFCQKCGSKVESNNIFEEISSEKICVDTIDEIEKPNEESFENIINKKLKEEDVINKVNKQEVELSDNFNNVKKSEYMTLAKIVGLTTCLYLSINMIMQNEELCNKIDDIHEVSYLRLNDYNNSQKQLDDLYKQVKILEIENEALNLKLDDAKYWFEMTPEQKQAIINEKQDKGATAYNTGITYDQIAKNPQEFVGQNVGFEGKVIQVLEIGEEVRIRVSLDENEEQVLYGIFDKSLIPYRILEGDIISVTGQSSGLFTYNSKEGKSISIPAIKIKQIEQVKPAESVESVQPVQPQK